MARLYIVRHGETDLNARRILQGPRIDAPLSAVGHDQAKALAEHLVDAGINRLLTSPLQRARQTAQHFVDATGLTMEVVPELYEVDYGEMAGRSVDDIRDRLDQILDAWRMGFADQAFPGGESAVLAQHRIRPVAARLAETPDDTLVVGHGHINRILLASLLQTGLDGLDAYPQANGAITELDDLRPLRVNDTSHLE